MKTQALCAILVALTPQTLAANPTISTQLYGLFQKYTKYAAAAYASSCPMPPNSAVVVAYLANTTTDTQATIFRNDRDSEIIVAFPGTQTAADFATDANQALAPFDAVGIKCTACQVHNGTLVAWNSITNQVITTLNAQQKTYPSYKPIVTGHSLGGALASMASASLVGLGKAVTTYTFGQFRTGNPAYANYIDAILPRGRIYRVTHTNDGVPQTINQTMGYRHHSTEYWELEPFGANDTQQCRGQDPPDCNNSEPGYGIGNNGIGINPAHLCYTGIRIGDPTDAGASSCNAVAALSQNCTGGVPVNITLPA